MDKLGASEPFRFTLDTLHGAAALGSSAVATDALLQQTRAELLRVTEEISRLCKSDIEPPLFWDKFLPQILTATAGEGVILWQRENQAWVSLAVCGEVAAELLRTPSHPPAKPPILPIAPENSASSSDTTPHDRLIAEVADTSGPVVVPPGSHWDSSEPGNPTQRPVALLPIELEEDQPTELLLEVFLPSGGNASTHRGYLRFLSQMIEEATAYLRRTNLRQTQKRESDLIAIGELLRFLTSIRDKPSFSREFTRKLATFFCADRVSLVYQETPSDPAIAIGISHAPSIDAKSPTVLEIGRLASQACGTPGMHWEPRSLASRVGNAEKPDAGKDPAGPPQLEPRGVVLIDRAGQWKLVIEDKLPPAATPDESRLWQYLVPQLALLLDTVPGIKPDGALSRLRKTLRTTRVLGGRFSLPLLMLTTLGITALIPVPFVVTAQGYLEPQQLQTVYAPRDAVIQRVLVVDGQRIEAGQPLVELSAPELVHSIQALRGRKIVLESRISELQQKLIDGPSSDRENLFRVQSELASLRQERFGVNEEIQLLEQQQEELVLVSRFAGIVDAWQLQDHSFERPVARGQALLRVFDDQGDWTVFAGIPENRVAHLLAEPRKEEYSVTVVLSSAPNHFVAGTLKQIGSSIQSDDRLSSLDKVVAARIEVTTKPLPMPQPGAPATISISCGFAPVGFVIGEDLIRMLRSTIALYR